MHPEVPRGAHWFNHLIIVPLHSALTAHYFAAGIGTTSTTCRPSLFVALPGFRPR
jgi:hypothetical protein